MLNNCLIFILKFLEDLYNKFISLNKEILLNFIIYNKFILLFIFITYILVILDNRFMLKNKIFIFIFIFISILLLNMYNYIDLSLFIKELYWYSLILNTSFIIHYCWFHWIYSIFWKYRYEKICWIISRIAFIFSLSFIVILINTIYILYNKFLDYLVENKNTYKIISKNKIIKHLLIFISHFILVLSVILRYFIILFLNYSSLIIGNKTLKDFNLINIIIFIGFFIFSYIMSYGILGIPRIIFIWIFFFIIISLELLINYCINFNENNPSIKANLIEKIYYFFFPDFVNIIIRQQIEKPQHNSLFYKDGLYDEVYGLYNINYKGNYNRPQYCFLFVQEKNFEKLKNTYQWIFIYNKSWYSYCYELLLICDIDESEDLLNKFIIVDNLTKNEIITLNNLYIEKKNKIINDIFK